MSEPCVPGAVIHAAIDPGGQTHVGVFLAKASDHAPPPELHPRADLLKCAGAELACCATCSRMLAPAALVHQRWVDPAIGSVCGYYSDVDRYRSLYTVMTAHEIAVLDENQLLKARMQNTPQPERERAG